MSALNAQLPDVIFTYGTLRPGLGERPEARAFRASATLVGPATFQGKLYSIDWYPGVIDSANPLDRVIGDLYQVPQDPEFFTKLDIYEMCAPDRPQPHEYKRAIRQVTHGGQLIPAWVYLFNWQITDQHLITSGDYADHVAGKP